jgi:hypothetical protein
MSFVRKGEAISDMPKKKSIRKAAQNFIDSVTDVKEFLTDSLPGTPPEYHGWLFDHAIVRIYRYFEALILEALIGAINQDTGTISARTGVTFPRHLTDEVCEYLIVGDGYFDFKGRDGLIRQIRRFVPDFHYLIRVVKQEKYRASLEQISALRNFTAHESSISKSRVKAATRASRIRCAGVWIQSRDRFKVLTNKLIELAEEIKSTAPY